MIPLPFALTPFLLKMIGTGALVLVLVGSCVMRDRTIENRGAAKATAKIEKATKDASSAGSAAARQSRVGGMHGKRDPYTRD